MICHKESNLINLVLLSHNLKMSLLKSIDSISTVTESSVSSESTYSSHSTETSTSEQYFKKNDEKVKILVAMMIGTKYNEHTLINDSSLQTFGMKMKDIIPVNQQLRFEILRRKSLFCDNSKTKHNMKREDLIDWLQKNPIKDNGCVKFMKEKLVLV